MIIGVPKEIKPQENRIGAVPAMVLELVQAGNTVLIEKNGGIGAGITDEQYVGVGGKIVDTAAEVYDRGEMIIKVKEPLATEYPMIKKGQLLFTYFHFAASRELTEAMLKSGAHCFAYETLIHNGTLPLLTPMSEVAGRMASQVGAVCLEKHFGSRGILLGGVPGVEPATVVVLGGGVVGTNAAKIAAGMGADVRILDVDLDRLRYLDDVMAANCTMLHSSPISIREQILQADLVIGAVLLQGARAPMLVKRADLADMQDGAVIVDVAVDQGGCVETCKPTTHADPTFVVDGVLHYCVANMPGAVPRTSTFGLTNATGPWATRLAGMGAKAAAQDSELGTAANVLAGVCTHQGVADAFDLECQAPATVL